MTATSPVGSPARERPAPGDAPAKAGDVPARADGLELIGAMRGSGYRTPPSLVRRRDGQTIQLTPLLYHIVEAVDGQRSTADVAARVSATSGRTVSAGDVEHLIDAKLRPLGLLRRADGSQPELKRADPLLGLRFRYVVADPASTRRLTAPFAVLFHPVVILAVLAAFVVVCTRVLFQTGLAAATHDAFDRPGLLLTVFVVAIISAGFHEFGHAAAARYGGATPGAMGAGLYLMWPAFYTDVTDSYRLGRGGRLRTDLGGLYFNTIVAVAMFGVWWATGWEALLLIIPAQVLQMIQQLTPLLRFDGYHLLADLTGVPDLYHRIKPTLRGLLPGHWHDPEAKVLKPWARAVVTSWVVLFVPLMLLTLALMVAAFPRIAATAWSSLREQWTSLGGAADDGDVLGGVAAVLSAIAIALPLAGLVYMLTRLARRVVRKVRESTAGRPARRRLAAATTGALIVALAWAWWPGIANYQPVQAYERGTIGDALPAAGSPAGLESGRGGGAETVWAGGAMPTRDEPVLAVVLVPVDDADAPAWVFPFDRPLPPGEGDNQALAVNTEDGTIVYDVAFALVWVEDGTVLNTNEAFALASCTDCAAVAVGFQVILSIGQVDVAVPQNLSGAVTYACVRCVTYALATQLVITLPDELSADAMAELAALWAEIARFGANIEDVPLAELQDRLRRFEARILDIVERDAEAATASSQQSVTEATTAETGPASTAPAEPAATVAPEDSTLTTSPPLATMEPSALPADDSPTATSTAARTEETAAPATSG